MNLLSLSVAFESVIIQNILGSPVVAFWPCDSFHFAVETYFLKAVLILRNIQRSFGIRFDYNKVEIKLCYTSFI